MGGGGLEADPKFYENSMYRAMDNKTIMRWAHEDILALAKDEDFDVSLACFYTYTMNCKQGMYQARWHHIGRQINANISFH